MGKIGWLFIGMIILILVSACGFTNDLGERFWQTTPTKSPMTTGRKFPTLVTLTVTATTTNTPTLTQTATVTVTPEFSETSLPTATRTPAPTLPPTRVPTKLPTVVSGDSASSGGCDGEDYGVEAEVLNLINSQRASAGLGSVTLSSGLSDVARSYSRSMAENNFFGHGDFSSRIYSSGQFTAVGEILYAGMASYNQPSAAVGAWLNSSSHRETMLNSIYTMAGVGYWCDPNSTYGGYYTVDFARP